jgi:hypothetical protein
LRRSYFTFFFTPSQTLTAILITFELIRTLIRPQVTIKYQRLHSLQVAKCAVAVQHVCVTVCMKISSRKPETKSDYANHSLRSYGQSMYVRHCKSWGSFHPTTQPSQKASCPSGTALPVLKGDSQGTIRIHTLAIFTV